MAEYKSNVAVINHNIELIYSKLSNPESLKTMSNLIPDEARGKVEDIQFSDNSITVKANPVGEIKLQVVELNEPNKIVYSAISSPIPFKVTINLEAIEDNVTNGMAIIDLEIPVMLKPMVQGPLTQACEKFSELLKIIPYDKL